MNNQWPLLVAALVITTAAAFGLYRRETAASTALQMDVPRPLPTVVAPPERPSAPSAVPAGPGVNLTPAPNPQPKKRIINPVVPNKPAEAPPVGAVDPAPVAPVAPAANPNVAVPRPRAAGRLQILLDLQEDLKTRLQMVSIPLPNGGYKFSMDGAHLEVVTTPSWQITIYNINPKQPEVETDSFKTLLAAVVSNLGINMNQKPVEAATGKSYLRTVSKMGAISLERDPAAGNSALIKPMTPTPAVDVAQPAPVVPAAPIAPVAPANPAPGAQPPAVIKKPAADF